MNPLPIPSIPSSAVDLERCRLESTIDQDLASLSLASLLTGTISHSHSHSHSLASSSGLSTLASLEYPRAFGEGDTGRSMEFVHPHHFEQQPRKPSYDRYTHPYGPEHQHRAVGADRHGPHGTPRAAVRKTSGISSIAESPVSTAGHHVSQVTLADGVFRRRGGEGEESEFDPERSLGRLVGELGRAMGSKISARPSSPFSPPRSPRSPSPLPSLVATSGNHQANLSLTLNRNDPLPSPPNSRSGSGSSGDYTNVAAELKARSKVTGSRFSSMARELGGELKQRKSQSQPTRRPLGETGAHNVMATPGPKKSRINALQNELGKKSFPGDITGMTGLMETPARGGDYGILGKNDDVGGDAAGAIPQTLATLHARLRALETENSVSRRRVRELEAELEQARVEVEAAQRNGDRQLREVIGEKTALEDLIKSLRAHLARLTVELEQNKALVSELRTAQQSLVASPPRSKSVTIELAELRHEVERLGKEVGRLGGIVEEGLETRRRARGERTVRIEEEEEEVNRLHPTLNQKTPAHHANFTQNVTTRRPADFTQNLEDLERVKRDVERRQTQLTQEPSKLRQGLHQAASAQPQLMPPTAAPPTRTQSRHIPTPPASDDGSLSPTPASRSFTSRHKKSRRSTTRIEGPASPFPSIRAEDEDSFFSALAEKETANKAQIQSPWAKQFITTSAPVRSRTTSPLGTDDALPKQTTLARVVRELEDDFAHYKAVYAELADTYKLLDAASAVAKRRVLAEHLKEVIDTLEQKADQISSLYNLLEFRDQPAAPGQEPRRVSKSVPDVLRMVRDSLGEEGIKRLREDGVGSRKMHGVV